MRKSLPVLLAILICACSSPQVEEDKKPTPGDQSKAEQSSSETDWNGHHRLTGDVRPDSYDLHLTIDPTGETFSGQVTIAATVERATDTIRMHGESLDFSAVEATREGESLEVDHEAVKNGGLLLNFDEQVEPGPITLAFAYTAPLDDVPEGLYRVKDGGSWYAFTQFEPLEAREAFPCFDEPRFKTPFKTRVTVPEGLMAATNGPKVGQTKTEDGVVWEFAETKPLPSYLVGFAVGDFDVLEAPDDAMGGVPLRVLTTKGKSKLAEYALEKTPELVAVQKEYFDSDFPFQKMDLVAVPNFAAGAMENVGLVTYRESILLLDAEKASTRDKYVALSVMAHEYAHMWFGNQVTPEWWDDLWLNEAFATWMGGRTVQKVSPELEPEIEAIRSRGRVMSADSLKKSRAIRQPIETGGDVYNAFDGITYSKGAAILRMFEAWVGTEPFRAGVRDYLEAHAYRAAETGDLLSALDESTGKPVSEVIANFLDQPGAPMVTAKLDEASCEAGEPTLQLEQRRYLPVGSEAEQGEPWQIPMCIWYAGGDGEKQKKCFLFDGSQESPRTDTVELETEACPTAIHPNADEKGYYHWKVEPASMRNALLEKPERMSLAERVAILGHLDALVRADALSPKAHLTALDGLSDQTHRLIVKQIVSTLNNLESAVYRGEPTDAFRQWVGGLVGPHLERVGFAPTKGESVGASLLRPKLVKAMANLAADASVREQADEVTEAYLNDPESADMTVAKFALDISARRGDEALWKKMRGALDDAPTPGMRSQVLSALGHFHDPELAKRSLGLILTDAVRAQNVWRILGPVSGNPALTDLAWTWLTSNYDPLVDKLGKSGSGSLPWVGGSYCSTEDQKKVESFFSKEEHRVIGTDRNLAQATESIGQCVRYRELVGEDVRGFVDAQ